MKLESAEPKHLILISLLVLPVCALENLGNGKETSMQDPPFHLTQSSNNTEIGVTKQITNENESNLQEFCSNTTLEDNGTIETDLTFFFSMNRTSANQCLKRKLLDKIKDTDNSCKNLIEDESFAWDYVLINKSRVLWYPIIDCNNTNSCNSVNESFQNCKKTSHMSTLPWKCGFQNNTRNYSKAFVYLHIYNQSLLSNCKYSLCMGSYLNLSNMTFINLTDSKADNCTKELETFPSGFCYEKETLCFHPFNITYIQKGIAFITKDTNNLTATEKIVTILSKFTMLRDSSWCKYPLNYTTRPRIIQNVYQTFFYCYGDKDETNTSNSWVFANISETESIVALNSNVNTSIIPSNAMLQALIATSVTINTTVYKSFEKSGITLEYHSELFNLSVFNNDNQSAVNELLQMITAKHCTVNSNKYFTTLTDKRSIWSPLNWIIFHNCTHHGGDKDLFLFWHNDTDGLESICNENTVILMTSIRRENVTFIDIKQIQNCTDGSLNNSSSEHCQSLIKDGSDYETQFFQFLVYQKTMGKKSLIEELTRKFNEGNANQNLMLTFGVNTHPDLRGGILNLTKTFESNTSRNIPKDEQNLSKSLEEILQIFVIANLTNNTDCLEDIQNDRFSIDITEDEHSNKVYEISPAPTGVSEASCWKILTLDILQNLKPVGFNKFWITCISCKSVAWNETVNGKSEWENLPKECKMIETFLLVFFFIITIITIIGNILVIMIIIATKLVKKHAFMLYLSLALADLLIGITSSLNALIDTYFLMKGHALYGLKENGLSGAIQNIIKNKLGGFPDLILRREGWPVFLGMTMNISIMSSLMSLALLGIDRLLMLKMLSFKDKHIRIAIITIWIWNITCSLLIGIQLEEIEKRDVLVGYFDPITKLTLNIGWQDYSVSSIVFKIQLFIGGIAGVIVVIASIASMIVYNFEENKNNKQVMRIHDQRRGEKIKVVTRTFLMMVMLFLVSCAPIAYTIINKTITESVTNSNTNSSIHPVFHFMKWWLCVAGSSWNWVIYCFRGTYFKQEAKKLWKKFC